MNALIVEDEKAALRNLKALLAQVAPALHVAGETDSIADTLDWLADHPCPDLVFMDIQLADGPAFDIFDRTDIGCPVIFTTAYDEYALKAFGVNSIDYLLKPINADDLARALDKLQRLTHPLPGRDYRRLAGELRQAAYQNHFLVPLKGNKYLPVSADSLLYFYISGGTVKAMDENGRELPFAQTLDELADCLDPHRFFRANRQFLIARKAIRDIDLWFNGRLAVNLVCPTPEKVLISKAKAAEFKQWLTE